MPPLGSLFAEIAAMAVLASRLPVVLLTASPVLLDLITGTCYLDSMWHSLLMNCGSELFSLEDFFTSAYACNQYFWDILAMVGNYIPPGFAQTFLNGMTAMGENSGISTFMPGVIRAFSKISSNNPMDGLNAAGQMFAGTVTGGRLSLFMKLAINPIAAIHWIWRMGSRIVVALLQATKQGTGSLASAFWNTLYDGRVDYDTLIAQRMLNTCGGFSLMAGYTSTPLGSVIFHFCSAGVKSTTAILDIASVFLVDMPIIICICRQTSGNNPREWILNHCNAPAGLKPLLRTIIDSPSSCNTMVNLTNANLTDVFDDTFGELFAGSNSVGSVLDSFLGALDDNEAGQCFNFESNPYVVTLIPEPVDYWRVCGNTDVCRQRCQQQMDAFHSVVPASTIRSSSASQIVDSLFFPTLNNDAYQPFKEGVVALIELASCTMICPEPDDRCFLSTGFVQASTLRIAQFCVPSALGLGVSKVGQWDTLQVSGLSIDIQFIRVDHQNQAWPNTYGLVALQAQTLQVCTQITQLTCSVFNPADVDVGVASFLKMQTLNDVLVLQVSMSAVQATANYCMRFVNQIEWVFSSCENTNVWDQALYQIVMTAQSQALLLPYDNVPLQLCQLDNTGVQLVFCAQYNGFDQQDVPVKSQQGMQSRVSQYVSTQYGVFIASNEATRWLTMLFVTISGGGTVSSTLTNSMPVSMQYTLAQGCSLDMCTGCTQLSVQRLCFAAQECQVARCIGSQVNQLRPFCAIGGLVQSQCFSMLAIAQGIWTMISGALGLVIDASGGINPPSSINWPDEVFYGLICSLKDSLASLVSILTASINGLFQVFTSIQITAQGEAIDNSFTATFSLTLMSITNFLYQLSLAPLYAAIAVQKIMVCQTNSLIATVSGNNAITITDPAIQTASSYAAGECMAQVNTENVQGGPTGMNTAQALASSSTQILSRIAGLALSLPLDMLIHPVDVTFTYLLGVIMGLQDVLETADQTNCRAPDWTTRVLYKCPCGDQPVAIPPHRQMETYLDGAFWCSTVLALLNFDGSPKYVWNPYSLYELKQKLSDLDTYLDCVASTNDGTCSAPTDPVFQKQQIPLLSVYQRCLTNYQETSWDPGTYILFNQTIQTQLMLDIPPGIVSNASACLLSQNAIGGDNSACLRNFLQGTQLVDYFTYSNISDTNSPTSSMIDACLTFSGPAASSDPVISGPFAACLYETSNSSGCDIPHMIWSGRSNNAVPVATQHTLINANKDQLKDQAMNIMQTTQTQMINLITLLEQTWTGEEIDITIFSAEGDLLHQFADCVMQGPMGSMTLTPGPDGVEKVVWSRDPNGASSREFQLPCTGQALANRNGERDDEPPFTCGTYARRSVIKYFLRDWYGGVKDNTNARDAVIQVIKSVFAKWISTWSVDSNLMCTCPNGSAVGWECCTEQSNCATIPCPCPEGYQVKASVACCSSVCGGLAGSGIMADFATIPGANISVQLMQAMGAYLDNEIWISNDPWLACDPGGADSYKTSWNQSQYDVINAGLFDASQPVVYYDEFRYPFQATFWEYCTGLLQQVIWTMPMDRSTGKPSGMGAPYDPINGQSKTPNLTYIEDYIQSLTTQAYLSSPVYWHYNVRHTPSQSEVCQRQVPRSINATTFPIAGNAAAQLGFSSLTLGGLGGADCYCGWWWNASCRIPDVLCASLVQMLGFTRICQQQQQVYNASDHLAVLQAVNTLLQMEPSMVYPCPSLQISEHWGFIDPATGLPFANATQSILSEGVSGFRVGNAGWLFSEQSTILNPSSRIEFPETPTASVTLQCNASANPSIADLFIDDLFPSAQGVRQSMPQSYCVRYGIELARLTVYNQAGLVDAAAQQLSVVETWRMRCQYKLEDLAVCNSFDIFNTSGGPTSTESCPFTLYVVSTMQKSYAVTPGCLVVLWNTPNNGQQDGIYDPCLCVPCTNTPPIDVPAQLTSLCLLEPFQQLVANDVIPGETSAGVPLGSGNFEALLQKPGLLQVNTAEQNLWALHTGIRDADLITDWWPDEWTQPVGYHVTPGCSRPKDAHWKTFDASWRWDSVLEQMVLARDETNDPLMSRNAFGASGVCRTNNYGMPMTTLNTMAVCTKENANAQTDPMVAQPTAQPAWVDGAVNCASDPFSTPWTVDHTQNPPRQWSVGTLQNETALQTFKATEWGTGCGPYPLKTCTSSSDCASGLTCLLMPQSSVGVCGTIQQGAFECACHAHCNDDKMCAGDGLCVDGVWQILNDLPDTPVSFRTYSESCGTGNILDTLGTSIAELLPDILNSSGLCSYRAWFENRRMASRNFCNTSNTCTISGTQPWNFTAPDLQQINGQSAFDDGVLKLQAHPCDRDYQYYEGFVSCTPNANQVALFDGNGHEQLNMYANDNRTRTYQNTPNLQLSLIHHPDETMGPSFGFTGVEKTYTDLNLGTGNPGIKACAQLGICSLQPSFMVNNQHVDARLVWDPAVGGQRQYDINDLTTCGIFGIVSGTQCQLDFAVVPLAFLVINSFYTFGVTPRNVGGLGSAFYSQNSISVMATLLQSLPNLFINTYIQNGQGMATTLQDFAVQAERFNTLYAAISSVTLNKPNYANAGTPHQLYYIAPNGFGAYEVPFHWWFKCSWLMGQPMNELSSNCNVKSLQGNGSQPTSFGPMDARLAALLGLSTQANQLYPYLSLQNILANAPGILTTTILNQAYTDFITNRNHILNQFSNAVLNNIKYGCWSSKTYNAQFSAASPRYQARQVEQMQTGGRLFDLIDPYYDIHNNFVCQGAGCLTDAAFQIPTKSYTNITNAIFPFIVGTAVETNVIPLTTPIPNVPGKIGIPNLFSAFTPAQTAWNNLLNNFTSEPTPGCLPVTSTSQQGISLSCLCSTWDQCSADVQTLLSTANGFTTSPTVSKIPQVVFKTTSNSNVNVDVCVPSYMLTQAGQCYLNDQTIPVDLSKVWTVEVPVGVVAELYAEKAWACNELICDSSDAAQNKTFVPTYFQPFTVTNQHSVIIQEFNYTQIIGYNKQNPWTSASQQQSEIACEESGGRFTFCGGILCCDTCNTPSHVVEASNPYQFITRMLEYFVNQTLVAVLEFYPCVDNPDDQLETVVSSFNSYNQYRSEPLIFYECTNLWDVNGMPDPQSFVQKYLRPKITRLYSSNGQTLESILNDIQSVVSQGNAVVNEWCSSGTCEAPNINVQNIPLTTKQTNSMCETLKSDTLLGCSMWPGENTETDGSTNSALSTINSIDVGANNWLNDIQTGAPPSQIASDGWNALTGWIHFRRLLQLTDLNPLNALPCQQPGGITNLQIIQCLNDASNNPCQSTDSSLRNMQLTGRTLIYTVDTTTPPCQKKEPAMSCNLMNELNTLKQFPSDAPCPGIGASGTQSAMQLQRYQDYINLEASGLLNTIILSPQIISGNSPPPEIEQSFQHMFLGLNPGFQCSNDPTIQGCTSSANKMLVEMRQNLYQCIQCPLVSWTQCQGFNDCVLTLQPLQNEATLSLLPGWNVLPLASQNFLKGGAPSSIGDVVPALQWLTDQVLNISTMGITSMSYENTAFMSSYSGGFAYEPNPVVSFDAYMAMTSKNCRAQGKIPPVGNCTFDGHWKDLKQFVEANYKVNEGLILPPSYTAQWRVTKSQMITQNIPQWEAISNSRNGLFLSNLFNTEWCLKANLLESACYVQNDTIIGVLNPALLGAFEPSVGCDTAIIDQTRVVYAYCSDGSNSDCNTAFQQLENGQRMTCPLVQEAVQEVTVSSTTPSNLCSKTPTVEATCTNVHAMLGQPSSSLDGNPVSDLYSNQPWLGGLPQGLFQNPLFQGQTPSGATPSNLILNNGDIGGHYVRMVLSVTRSGAYVMSVQGVPLSSYPNAFDSATYAIGVQATSTAWMQIQTAVETGLLTSLYPNSVCNSWDCPLRRRAFYMGSSANFRPMVPDPLRSQILYGSMVHPTQKASPLPLVMSINNRSASQVLGVYVSSNGFCACLSPPCNAVCSSDLGALYGVWTFSSVIGSKCTLQLDWPYSGGKLRDGSPPYSQRWSSTTSLPTCGILDRLPRFQYMYTNRQQTLPSKQTTLDKGGVCHMGWPVVTAGSLPGCYRIVETDNYMCPSFTHPKNVTRLQAKTIAQLLNSPNRPRLTDCTAPPTYTIGTKNTNPEVSYGQLKRWEASRLLANDLRRRLCGNSTTCAASKNWSLSTFWSTIYTTKMPPIPSGNGENASLWSKPWVACTQNGQTQTCDGTIPREKWANSNTRNGACMAALTNSSLVSKLAQSISICDLDSQLDTFCRQMNDARYRIFEANCLYSGQCRDQLFFYQPSTYEVNNGEFVRDTVQDFYNATVMGACMPDQDTAEAISRNAQALQNCAAVQLDTLVNCIQIVRTIVNLIVEIIYYLGEILISIFELLVANSSDQQAIISQIDNLLMLIANKFILLFQQIGDLIYQIIFVNGVMGKWLLGMIQAICMWLDWLISTIVNTLLCWIRTTVVWVLQNIAMPIANVLAGIPLSNLGYLPGDVNSAVTSVENALPCSSKQIWTCNLSPPQQNATPATDPMPTRCWAGAEPEIGSSLACTAADTCLNQADYSNVICAACPKAASMTQFGCDSLTKLCTCNIFPVGVSSCTTHEECTLDDADIDCQYVDSYLQASYGNVPCAQCPSPICLITNGNGIGQCSCLLRPVPSQTCSGVGQLVSPNAGQLCLIASASSTQSSTNSYSPDYQTLASTPCMLLNEAQSYCMAVFISGSVSTDLVVGLSLLSSTRRRHLLSTDTPRVLDINTSAWLGRGEPCRLLVQANESRLGVLEHYERTECWRWYCVGLKLTAEANLTRIVSPYIFTSWRDLIDVMLDRHAFMALIPKFPFIVRRILLHSEITQPLYLAIAYWVTKSRLWENNTIEESLLIKEFLLNVTQQPQQGRRLLSVHNVSAKRNLMQEAVISAAVSSQEVYEWSQGPYTWPPNFVYWNNGAPSCAATSTAIDVIENALEPTMRFYQQSSPPEPLPAWWPSVSPSIDIQHIAIDTRIDLSDIDSINQWAVRGLGNVTDSWLNRDATRAFLSSASYMDAVVQSIQCNFTRIQTCADRRPLMTSALQTVLLMLIVSIIGKVLGVPYMELVAAVMCIPTWFYIAYGYAPLCVPMVPTCALSDIIALVNWLLPTTIVWPAPLTLRPNCTSATCLRSCTQDANVGFASCYDHLAWLMCEVRGPQWATSTALSSLGTGSPLRIAVLRKCALDTSDAMRSAQRICFAITLVNSATLLLLVIAALWFAPTLMGMGTAALQFGINVMISFTIFVHTNENDENGTTD